MKNLKMKKEYSYNSQKTENLLIKGDSNIVLNEILDEYSQEVKCIYIDPPYNTGEKFNHYDDDLKHEVWLEKMKEILEKLKKFLTKDGSIWISINDREVHYFKVMADQVFGRKNFITSIIWQQRTTRENRKAFSGNHDHILVYCMNQKEFKNSRNLLPPNEELLSRYKNPDNDPKGKWQSISVNVQAGHASKNQFYEIIAPNGKIHIPPIGRCWAYNKERMMKEIESGKIWFGETGEGVPRVKKYLCEVKKLGLTPETIWLGEEVGTNKSAKKHILKLFPNDKDVFDTPKPEELIKRILEIASNPGDIIMDAFLGSGTTISVAHQLKRKFIGIEQGDHIVDLVIERMKCHFENNDNSLNQDYHQGFKFLELKHLPE